MILPAQINSLYDHIETLNLKDFGIRKKIDVFITKNSKDEDCIIFYITQKSRFLQKDADKIEEIKTIILNNIPYEITSKIILIKSPLCSKAKDKLEKSNWIVTI